MKIIDVSQSSETFAWLEERRKTVTGTKAGEMILEPCRQKDISRIAKMAGTALESAKKAKTAAKAEEYKKKYNQYLQEARQADKENKKRKVKKGFYSYVAEFVADEDDSMNPMERGHMLENENAQIVLDKLGIDDANANYDTGIWKTDDGELGESPDVQENSLTPTWAIECKSFNTATHLSYVFPIVVWRLLQDDSLEADTVSAYYDMALELFPWILEKTRRFDFVPDDYKYQVLQYFIVNEKLECLYFSFYDNRINNPQLAHVYLAIHRETIESDISATKQAISESIAVKNNLITLSNNSDYLSEWVEK